MRTTGLCLSFALLGLGVGSAGAGFELCNRSGKPASLAVGYLDGPRGWTAQGWANIDDGVCATLVAGPLAGSFVYVLVDKKPLGAAPGQKGGWFCTSNRGFVTRNNDYADAQRGLLCAAAGLKLERFRQVPVRSGAAKLDLK